jgi:cytochrome c
VAARPAQAPTPAAIPAGNAERGQELYESRCFACHSLGANRVGPRHEGLFGRTAGKLRDYDYSAALKASKVVWNEKTLDTWLADPQALIPGQKMNYAITDPAARADIIAYLKAASAK